jgi:hypothetical protein
VTLCHYKPTIGDGDSLPDSPRWTYDKGCDDDHTDEFVNGDSFNIPPPPPITGHTFSGRNTSPNCEGVNISSTITLTDHMRLYGCRVANKYRLSYDRQ